MSYIVDRRLNGRNKSAVNRQRFLRRYREHIRKAVADAVNRRSITDMERGEEISIPTREIDEPNFQHGQGGRRQYVHPGNREFHAGDRIARPPAGGQGQGGGGGSGSASPDGQGEDTFVFSLTREEFLDFLFDDLELPNLERTELAQIEHTRQVHAGIIREGTPSRINVVRSMRSAYGRRLAMGSSLRQALKAAEQELAHLQAQAPVDLQAVAELEQQIAHLQKRLQKIPFLDTYDLRYNHFAQEPVASSQAVMFCIMDVSGSMTQNHKDIAKRFFLLLYLFLERHYERIDLVFVRHHTSAREVNEQDFFYSRETGGTIVSSALKLVNEIIDKRYPTSLWNIYCAQASDGDNWDDDSSQCASLLEEALLPKVRYFAYVEITPHEHQALWQEYEQIRAQHPERFAMQQIVDQKDIFPVFRELFKRRASL
ncbi:hypothetical protein SAMN05421831_104158 [Allopseudospirillum japonicum]|uniref:UPF0229 protein SAMN05421831_104158 n=1 Tax=Allopseudospirillum japonicum TaxID=64971 RepID=A0A1H6RXD5_9GAMM|nr:YeaH/YhbH family protein [Allopseudospirillum japonicum]SEI57207.1 hypothetical protein SAMN05421831_104158 [Allopseudospirillum japonicum]